MTKQIRHILIALLTILSIQTTFAAETSATQILDKAAKTLTSAKSVTVKFNYTAGSTRANGSMTLSGKKFTFNLGNLAVWYNGKLQWALNRSENEVSLTQPTAAEVVESNPFAILTSYKQHYTPSLSKKTGNEYTISLKPKSRSNQIAAATIKINATNYQPKALTLRLSDGSIINVAVTSISRGDALPASYFQFDARSNPKIEVIDLR